MDIPVRGLGLSTKFPESALSPALLRALGDRSYDKRKNAASEVSAMIRSLAATNELERVLSVTQLLTDDYVNSRNVNQRKGGLMALAATAVGLASTTQDSNALEHFLFDFVAIIMDRFEDENSRVAYHACEAMYNIAKVARHKILQCFNALFDGICKLYTSSDTELHRAAECLDNIMKDIVTEADADGDFDMDNFLPFLQHQLVASKRHMRQLVVSWVGVLDGVPDFNMLDRLPLLMPGLFNVLEIASCEPSDWPEYGEDLIQATLDVLSSFLQQICEVPIRSYHTMTKILVVYGNAQVRLQRYSALVWLFALTVLADELVVDQIPDVLQCVLACMNFSDLEVSDIMTADIDVMRVLKPLTDAQLEMHVTPSDEVLLTLRCYAALLGLAQNVLPEALPMGALYHVLVSKVGLTADRSAPKVAAMQWILLLQGRQSLSTTTFMEDILPPLLEAMRDHVEEVVLLSVEVIAAAMVDSDDKLEHVLIHLTHVFLQDSSLLERRGAFVVRRLCALLPDPDALYMSIARQLGMRLREYEVAMDRDRQKNETAGSGAGDAAPPSPSSSSPLLHDLNTINCFTRILNLVLLTAPELSTLRESIKYVLHKPHKLGEPAQGDLADADGDTGNSSSSAEELFDVLYHCWCCNTMSTIMLCLLSREYYLAAAIISRVGSSDASVGFLSQGEKLLELLEAPVFLQVRLDLLRSCNAHLHSKQLLKALYGLLMLLPSSGNAQRLANRLKAVALSRLDGNTCNTFDNYTAISPDKMASFLGIYDRVQASMGFASIV